MEIFKLFGSILVDSDEANDSIADTEGRASKLGGTLGKGIATAAKWGAGLAAGAGVAIGGMAALIGKAIETTSQITKFSQVTGMSTKGFQEWDSVAKTFGFSMEAAAGDMAALAEKAMDAQSGIGENADIFKELGVSVEDSSGKLKTQEQLFNETIAGLQGMEDVTRRNAIATMFLSTTGEELAPVLNMTNEELQKMKDNTNVISEEDLAKAEDFRLKWEGVKSTFGGVVTQIGIGLMPLFEGLLGWVNSHMPTIQLVINTVFEALSTGIQIGIEWVRNFIGMIKQWGSDNTATFTTIKDTIQNVLGIIVAFIQEKLAAIQQFWTENGTQIKQAVENLFNGIKATIEFVMPAVLWLIKEVWGAIKNVIDGVLNVIMGLIKTFSGLLTGDFSKMWEGIKQLFSGALEAIWGLLQLGLLGRIFKLIKGFGKSAEDAISGMVKAMASKFDEIAIKASVVFNAVKDAIMVPINKAKDSVRTAIDNIKGYFSGMKLKLPDIKTPHFKLKNWSSNPTDWLDKMPSLGIDWYAKGGIMTQPTAFGFSGGNIQAGGEAGREAILPLNSNTFNSLAQSIVSAMGMQNQSSTPNIVQVMLDRKVLLEALATPLGKLQHSNYNSSARMKGVNP